MRIGLVLFRPYVIFRNSLMLRQLCAAENQRPYVFLSLMLWGSLVLQRRKDLLSFTNQPAISVLAMLRIWTASVFSTAKWTTQLGGQGMRNEAKTRLGSYSRPDHQSKGTSRKGNTQAKRRSDSVNVTKDILNILQKTSFIRLGVHQIWEFRITQICCANG